MTSGKFLHRFKLNFPCAAIVWALLAPSSYAQTQQQAQQPVYVPPPMFDDTPAVMVRPKTDNGYIVEPKTSPKPAAPVTPAQAPRTPVIVPRISVDPDSGRAAPPLTRPKPAQPVKPATPAPVKPAAPKTPSLVIEPKKAPAPAPAGKKPDIMKPIVEKKPSEKTEKEVYIKRDKAKAAAPEETKKQDVSETKAPPISGMDDAPMPAARVKHGGSIMSGPKTMPAVPTEDVDNQVLFNGDDDTPSQTILERHQSQTRKKQQEEKKRAETARSAPPPAVKEDTVPATAKARTFEDNGQDAMKRTLPMQPGQISLSPPLAQQIAGDVLQELGADGKKDWRVQIRAYAAPHGAGLSSDKRIALSRALALRSSLITQGVAPDKIDVLADGLENAGDERIDLYLYGPKAK